jgi:sulfur carrier protein
MSEPQVIIVNGATRTWRSDETIESLVSSFVASPRGIAVAVDQEVVPRSLWSTTSLDPGAVVEIVTAAAGG